LSEDFERHGKIAVWPPTLCATSVRALRDWGVSMASESSVVSFPAGKPASAKNRVSNSPNYRLEQLIALRDEYWRKAEIIDYAIKLLRSRL
jgi:hypothetical protein